MIAHELGYVAQASPHDPRDLVRKSAKALDTPGATFINVLAPCPRGWRADGAETIDLAREAVETCYWPLFEVVDGEYRLTYRPHHKKPLDPVAQAPGPLRPPVQARQRGVAAQPRGLGGQRVGEAPAQVRRAQRGRVAGVPAVQRLPPALSLQTATSRRTADAKDRGAARRPGPSSCMDAAGRRRARRPRAGQRKTASR